MTNTTDMYRATGEQIVAHFRTYSPEVWMAESWSPETDVVATCDVPGTSSTIQGILCCVDRDTTIAWLMMIVDSNPTVVSYLCCTFTRLPNWKWAWIKADHNLPACREFINWLELNDEWAAIGRSVTASAQ